MTAHADATAALAAAPESPHSPDFVTISQATAYAKVSRRTIYNWIAKGRLTVYRSAGGMLRLDRAELVRREAQ